MIDTHCHLQYPGLAEDVGEVLKRAREAGVTKVVVPGTGLETSETALKLSQEYPEVYAALGIHPIDDDAAEGDQEAVAELLARAETERGKVVAIGEVGMDYYHLPEGEEAAALARDEQVSRLAFFTQLAKQCKLPLIVHSRECFSDLYARLREWAPGHPTVIHCFVGNQDEADAWLDLGYHLSFTNILTYPKNAELRDVASRIPHDRFMLETDAPFLPPRNRRGGLCEPADVVSVADCLAEVRGVTVATIAEQTTATAESFFNFSGTSV
jgi:TatD DNase family protein